MYPHCRVCQEHEINCFMMIIIHIFQINFISTWSWSMRATCGYDMRHFPLYSFLFPHSFQFFIFLGQTRLLIFPLFEKVGLDCCVSALPKFVRQFAWILVFPCALWDRSPFSLKKLPQWVKSLPHLSTCDGNIKICPIYFKKKWNVNTRMKHLKQKWKSLNLDSNFFHLF